MYNCICVCKCFYKDGCDFLLIGVGLMVVMFVCDLVDVVNCVKIDYIWVDYVVDKCFGILVWFFLIVVDIVDVKVLIVEWIVSDLIVIIDYFCYYLD